MVGDVGASQKELHTHSHKHIHTRTHIIKHDTNTENNFPSTEYIARVRGDALLRLRENSETAALRSPFAVINDAPRAKQ
jgi:hypothetical protein